MAGENWFLKLFSDLVLRYMHTQMQVRAWVHMHARTCVHTHRDIEREEYENIFREKYLLIFFLVLFCVYGYFVWIYACESYTYMVPLEARRRCWIP